MDFNPFPPEPTKGHSMGMVVMAGLLCAAGAWIIATARHDAKLTALEETMRSEFRKIGESYQAKGHLGGQVEIDQATARALGKAFSQQVAREGGHIVGTVEAKGTVPASSVPFASIPTLPASDGSFSGSVAQDRGGLPPLTAANFVFHPGSGLSVGWENHAETFRLGFAEWRTSGDGLRAAARLSREVQGKVEEIPLVSADAYFPQAEVERLYPMPAWSFGIGAGMDVNGRPRTNFVIEKYLTRKLSIETGYVNGRASIMAKYQWGSR